MNIAQWFHAHRRSLLFLITILALAGLMSVFNLPVALFPNVSFPRVRVSIDAGNRPAHQMAIAVTRPLAEAIRSVRGVREVRSTTSRGSAELNVDFDWGANMSRAYLEVNAAASQVLPDLPPGTRISAVRMDPTVNEPVIAYSLRSNRLTQTQLYDLARYQLLPLLSGVKGVAKVGIQGRGIEELHVDVDPAKLRAQNLTMADVTRAVAAAATITALGRLADHYKLFLLLANNQPASVKALRNVVVRAGSGGVSTASNGTGSAGASGAASGNAAAQNASSGAAGTGGMVRVGDIATVTQSIQPEWVRTGANGRPAILLRVSAALGQLHRDGGCRQGQARQLRAAAPERREDGDLV
jgi:multidrug efflux pump subunit AcrB